VAKAPRLGALEDTMTTDPIAQPCTSCQIEFRLIQKNILSHARMILMNNNQTVTTETVLTIL